MASKRRPIIIPATNHHNSNIFKGLYGTGYMGRAIWLYGTGTTMTAIGYMEGLYGTGTTIAIFLQAFSGYIGYMGQARL